jgi:K+-transporting ATPase ATPase C chain
MEPIQSTGRGSSGNPVANLDGTREPARGTTILTELQQTLMPALVLFLILTFVTGVAYPLAVTVVAQFAFPSAANGSLIGDAQHHVGSELLGQSFTEPRYFWGRPSATTPAYNGLGGSGSNLATTNPALMDAVKDRIARLHAADPDNTAKIPVDLVTASASGLDPQISPTAAQYQAGRVARERGLPLEQVTKLIGQHTQMPTLGFLGQPRVDVLRLNLSLDSVK